MTCGFNAAMYFIGMDKNQGGAEAGTHYCDAQAVGGTYCSELDIFEGNTAAQQITTHGCVDACATYSDNQQCKYNPSPNNICDHSGCGLNPFRYGPGSSYDADVNNEGFYGLGSQHQIDTSKPFTVTTQFHENHIARYYTQNGQHVDLPTLYVRTPTDGSHYGPFYGPKITDEYCGLTYDSWTGDAGLSPAAQMLKNAANGMVLSMSAWYDQETYNSDGHPNGDSTGMSWLDGVNNWGKWTKTGPCHTTTSDSGNHRAKFSKIKFGDFGTTAPAAPPAPPPPAPVPVPPAPVPPPAPAPTPSGSGQCCYGGCGVSCNAGWCGESKSNCENNCSGQWCEAPAPSPAPGPSPGCDCSWVDTWGCGGDDGSLCWGQCCSGNTCDCSWVSKWGCGSNDGSVCWGQCCGAEVSV